jgi:hypothetical protein
LTNPNTPQFPQDQSGDGGSSGSGGAPYTGPGSVGNPVPWVNGQSKPTTGTPDPVHTQAAPTPPGLNVVARILGWAGAIGFVVMFVFLFATDHEKGRAWGLLVPGIAALGIALTMGWRPFGSRK